MSSSTGPTRSGGGSPTIAGAELPPGDRTQLLQLARATLEAHLTGGALPPLPDDALCGRLTGAFVTIRVAGALRGCLGRLAADRPLGVDRKSTRLNSSHSQISYAVFCLKKKKKTRS